MALVHRAAPRRSVCNLLGGCRRWRATGTKEGPTDRRGAATRRPDGPQGPLNCGDGRAPACTRPADWQWARLGAEEWGLSLPYLPPWQGSRWAEFPRASQRSWGVSSFFWQSSVCGGILESPFMPLTHPGWHPFIDY